MAFTVFTLMRFSSLREKCHAVTAQQVLDLLHVQGTGHGKANHVKYT